MSDHSAETPNRWVPSPQVRNYIYKVLASAGPVVVFYGLATGEEIILWLGLAGTALGTPTGALAAANTPK